MTSNKGLAMATQKRHSEEPLHKCLCEEPAGDEAISRHYVTKGQIAAAAAAASQ